MITFIVLLACVVGSALFAGMETGYVTLNRVRIRVRANRGDARAKRLLGLLDHPERLLTTFLVGNTLCNVGGGAIAANRASQYLGDAVGFPLATVVMTLVFLMFGEMVPKLYFRNHGEELLPRLTGFIRLCSWLFAPLVAVSTRVLMLIGGSAARGLFVTREELRQLVRESGGRLGLEQKRMLDSVFDFGQTSVREVMIPLPGVVSLAESAGTEELLELVRLRGYTRIPVYRDRVDRIVGLVTVFDPLFDPERRARASDYLRPIPIVPDTRNIPQVLVELQHRRDTMALVVNEFGACVGIVTVEDIVEEIMGELGDEHEELHRPLEATADGYLVEAGLDIDDLNAELGLSIAKDDFETVAGLILKRLGRIPEVGERVRVGRLEFEILAVHQYGLRRLKLRDLGASLEGTGDDG